MKVLAAKGFTLIELLVVIVLLGVITTFAVLSMGTGSLSRELEEEAKRLHALINLAKEESIIQAKEVALEVDGQEYLFLGYVENKWVPLGEKVFRKRKLIDSFELSIDLDSEQKLLESKDEEVTRLYFLSSGEQTPFEIRLKIKEQSAEWYVIRGEYSGKLELEHKVDDYFQVSIINMQLARDDV